MLMLVIIEGTTRTSPTMARLRLERSFMLQSRQQPALSAALVCCPTSPEDAIVVEYTRNEQG